MLYDRYLGPRYVRMSRIRCTHLLDLTKHLITIHHSVSSTSAKYIHEYILRLVRNLDPRATEMLSQPRSESKALESSPLTML